MKREKKYKPALWKQIQDESKTPTKHVVKRIKPRTSKRAKEEAQYRKRVKEWLKNKTCDGCLCDPNSLTAHAIQMATEVHHFAGRRGKLLNYEPYWLGLCKSCHQFVHDHPKTARLRGLLCEVGSWNNQSLVPKYYYE